MYNVFLISRKKLITRLLSMLTLVKIGWRQADCYEGTLETLDKYTTTLTMPIRNYSK